MESSFVDLSDDVTDGSSLGSRRSRRSTSSTSSTTERESTITSEIRRSAESRPSTSPDSLSSHSSRLPQCSGVRNALFTPRRRSSTESHHPCKSPEKSHTLPIPWDEHTTINRDDENGIPASEGAYSPTAEGNEETIQDERLVESTGIMGDERTQEEEVKKDDHQVESIRFDINMNSDQARAFDDSLQDDSTVIDHDANQLDDSILVEDGSNLFEVQGQVFDEAAHYRRPLSDGEMTILPSHLPEGLSTWTGSPTQCVSPVNVNSSDHGFSFFGDQLESSSDIRSVYSASLHPLPSNTNWKSFTVLGSSNNHMTDILCVDLDDEVSMNTSQERHMTGNDESTRYVDLFNPDDIENGHLNDSYSQEFDSDVTLTEDELTEDQEDQEDDDVNMIDDEMPSLPKGLGSSVGALRHRRPVSADQPSDDPIGNDDDRMDEESPSKEDGEEERTALEMAWEDEACQTIEELREDRKMQFTEIARKLKSWQERFIVPIHYHLHKGSGLSKDTPLPLGSQLSLYLRSHHVASSISTRTFEYLIDAVGRSSDESMPFNISDCEVRMNTSDQAHQNPGHHVVQIPFDLSECLNLLTSDIETIEGMANRNRILQTIQILALELGGASKILDELYHHRMASEYILPDDIDPNDDEISTLNLYRYFDLIPSLLVTIESLASRHQMDTHVDLLTIQLQRIRNALVSITSNLSSLVHCYTQSPQAQNYCRLLLHTLNDPNSTAPFKMKILNRFISGMTLSSSLMPRDYLEAYKSYIEDFIDRSVILIMDQMKQANEAIFFHSLSSEPLARHHRFIAGTSSVTRSLLQSLIQFANVWGDASYRKDYQNTKTVINANQDNAIYQMLMHDIINRRLVVPFIQQIRTVTDVLRGQKETMQSMTGINKAFRRTRPVWLNIMRLLSLMVTLGITHRDALSPCRWNELDHSIAALIGILPLDHLDVSGSSDGLLYLPPLMLYWLKMITMHINHLLILEHDTQQTIDSSEEKMENLTLKLGYSTHHLQTIRPQFEKLRVFIRKMASSSDSHSLSSHIYLTLCRMVNSILFAMDGDTHKYIQELMNPAMIRRPSRTQA